MKALWCAEQAGINGHFTLHEDSASLFFDNLPSLQVKYDERNFLPISHATNATFSPQLNLNIIDAGNQNLTPSQKLLLHWHYRVGHKGF